MGLGRGREAAVLMRDSERAGAHGGRWGAQLASEGQQAFQRRKRRSGEREGQTLPLRPLQVCTRYERFPGKKKKVDLDPRPARIGCAPGEPDAWPRVVRRGDL